MGLKCNGFVHNIEETMGMMEGVMPSEGYEFQPIVLSIQHQRTSSCRL